MANNEFGERLRERRQAAGLDQRQLARAVGVGQSYISQLETGVSGPPTIDRARLLAAACRTSVDYLAGVVDNPAPPDSAGYPARRRAPAVEALADAVDALTQGRREDVAAIVDALAARDRARAAQNSEYDRLARLIAGRLGAERMEALLVDVLAALRAGDPGALEAVVARYFAEQQARGESPEKAEDHITLDGG